MKNKFLGAAVLAAATGACAPATTGKTASTPAQADTAAGQGNNRIVLEPVVITAQEKAPAKKTMSEAELYDALSQCPAAKIEFTCESLLAYAGKTADADAQAQKVFTQENLQSAGEATTVKALCSYTRAGDQVVGFTYELGKSYPAGTGDSVRVYAKGECTRDFDNVCGPMVCKDASLGAEVIRKSAQTICDTTTASQRTPEQQAFCRQKPAQ